MFQPTLVPLAIHWFIKMMYYMNLYLNWHRNQQGLKQNICFLLSKYLAFDFDPCQFLYQLRQKIIQYLILKLQSMVQWARVGQNMLALLGSEIALWKRAIQYIRWALFNFNLTGLYYQYPTKAKISIFSLRLLTLIEQALFIPRNPVNNAT